MPPWAISPNWIAPCTVLFVIVKHDIGSSLQEKILEVHKDDVSRRRGHEVRVHGVKVRRARNIVVGIDYK